MPTHEEGTAFKLTKKGARYINSEGSPCVAREGDVCWLAFDEHLELDIYIFANGSHNGNGHGWYLVEGEDVAPLTNEETENVPDR